MKLLVTGANGFIGSALYPHLLALGHEIVPSVRRPSDIDFKRIVDGEVSWKAAFGGCGSIIYLAARAHVMQDQERDRSSPIGNTSC